MPTEVPDPQRPDTASPTIEELEREMPGGIAAAGHDPYAALRLPAYRRFIAGVTLSRVGQEFQIAAMGWEITTRSARPALALSMLGLVGAAPVILLALPAGHLADSLDRKKLTIVTVLAASLCSVGLALVSFWQAPLILLYALLLLWTIASAIGGPAQSSLRAQIVPIELYSNATTWSSSFFQVASMVGPALAGGIIAIETIHVGRMAFATLPLAYLVDAACGVALAGLLAVTQVRPLERKSTAANLQTLLAGIQFVRNNKIILATITLDLFAVLLGGATYLLPIYAQSVLHVGAVGFGWMRAAPAIGALAMAMLVAHLPPMKKAGRNLLWTVIGFGIATIVFGLSELGAFAGEYGGANYVSAYTSLSFNSQMAVEAAVGQFLGRYSNGVTADIGLTHVPMPQWRFSPFLMLGIGILHIEPKATLIQPSDRTEQTAYVGGGIRYYVTRSLFLRAEYKTHVVITTQNRNQVEDEWKLGFAVFF